MSGQTQRIAAGEQLGRAKRGYDLLLGWAAMAPIVAGGVMVWLTPTDLAQLAGRLTIAWAGVLLTFFAGVRRGLSFSEQDGAKPSELASMLWLFALGLLTLVAQSALLAIVGFASVGVLDAFAARRLQAPPYFSRFRPAQMAVAIVGLGVLAVR